MNTLDKREFLIYFNGNKIFGIGIPKIPPAGGKVSRKGGI